MAVTVHSTIKPKNNRTFPVVEACDVDVNGTPLDKVVEEFDGRVEYIEKFYLGMHPDIPENPDAPALPQLKEPHIALYPDVVVTIPQLDPPEIYFLGDEGVKPDILDAPRIVLVDDTTDEPTEPDTPTIDTLKQPTIYMISDNNYYIEVGKRYVLPAIPNGGSKRTFALWVKVQATDNVTGKVYYSDETYYAYTINIRNQDYVLEISNMMTDNEGDCYFTYNVDGVVKRSLYVNLPKHSVCEIVKAKVIGVGDCYLAENVTTLPQLKPPFIYVA